MDVVKTVDVPVVLVVSEAFDYGKNKFGFQKYEAFLKGAFGKVSENNFEKD